jgi:fatty acid desaturase
MSRQSWYFGIFVAGIIFSFGNNAVLSFSVTTKSHPEAFRLANTFPTGTISLNSASTTFDPSNDTPEPIASVKALDVIIPRSAITQLSKKSDKQGLLQLSFIVGVLALSMSIPQPTISLLATAFVSSFFFHGLHETVHDTAFASPFLNRVVRHIFGFLCMRPARHYFYYHWQHHKYTGNPELDSELQTGSFLDFPINNMPTYLIYLTGIPFWIDAVGSLLRHSAGRCNEVYLSKNSKAAPEVVKEARLYFVCYILVACWMWKVPPVASSLLQYWMLPALLGQPFLRLYLLAEHRGMANSDNIIENTRTVATKNWFVRRLAWSMPYHKEHHSWPSVPFWNLYRVHELLPPAARGSNGGDSLYDELKECQSYIGFNWTFIKSLIKK